MPQKAGSKTESDNVSVHGHICPWWLAYTFDNPLRRLIHPPDKVLGEYVGGAMTVLDLGCGFGHFTIGMAKLIKEPGRVIAVDVQKKMLEKTMARASKKGVAHLIHPRLSGKNGLGIDGPVDFILASNVLHEAADLDNLLRQCAALLGPEKILYIMEPKGHVSPDRFEREIEIGRKAGFGVLRRPEILREYCVVMEKI